MTTDSAGALRWSPRPARCARSGTLLPLGKGLVVSDSPTTPHGQLRTHQVIVRTTDEEWERWNAAARAGGYGRTATWLRHVVDEHAAGACAPTVPDAGPALDAVPTAVLAELMAARHELQRIGNNLNQAVRALHTTGAGTAGVEQSVLEVRHMTRVVLDRVTQMAGER